MIFRIILLFTIFFLSCKSKEISYLTTQKHTASQYQNAIKLVEIKDNKVIDDTTFVNLKDYSDNFFYAMKYATTDNFLKQKVYDCDECYLRYKTVKLLLQANDEFNKKGYSIKIFDCYRPKSVQEKMWQIMPNPNYVADPKKGSLHNRGGAVDVTLVDKNGNDLDMGTAFDFFGVQAAHSYLKFSNRVIKNRKLLKEVMEKHKFVALNSEWWHYSVIDGNKQSISNFRWNCD